MKHCLNVFFLALSVLVITSCDCTLDGDCALTGVPISFQIVIGDELQQVDVSAISITTIATDQRIEVNPTNTVTVYNTFLPAEGLYKLVVGDRQKDLTIAWQVIEGDCCDTYELTSVIVGDSQLCSPSCTMPLTISM